MNTKYGDYENYNKASWVRSLTPSEIYDLTCSPRIQIQDSRRFGGIICPDKNILAFQH